MANTKISALTSASTPVAGTEVLPIVQSSATVKLAISDLTPGLSTITAAKGGTGQTTYAVGDLLYASAATTLSKLADVATGNALISGGVTTAPSWGKIGLATHVSGTLPTANGGTNLTSFTANGVVYASSASVLTTGSSFVFDGTNVGIGTSSPKGKLTVLAPSSTTLGDEATSAINIIGNNGASKFWQICFGAYDTSFTNAPSAIGYIQTTSSGFNNGALVFATRNVVTDTAPTERMRIANDGIVTMSAYGAGAATFSAAGVISSVSDETWKIKDGVPVDPDSMLKKLAPGYWYYNDEKKETFGVDRQLGFYAQNVNAAIGPEAAPVPETIISKAEDGTDIVTTKPWGYYDRSVLAITVMSLQKALATIESLTARIAALESR